jgi:hypothetical protein
MTCSLAREAIVGMTCQQQMLTQHNEVYQTKLWKTRIVLLKSINDKSPGSDNLGGKLLRITVDDIATSSI